MILDYSLIDAKGKLDKIINSAIENHTPIKIHSKDGKNAYIISEEDFNAFQETLYLLQNPHNSEILINSLRGKKYKRFDSIEDLKSETGLWRESIWRLSILDKKWEKKGTYTFLQLLLEFNEVEKGYSNY
mgnify:CR=1 FL=1